MKLTLLDTKTGKASTIQQSDAAFSFWAEGEGSRDRYRAEAAFPELVLDEEVIPDVSYRFLIKDVQPVPKGLDKPEALCILNDFYPWEVVLQKVLDRFDNL